MIDQTVYTKNYAPPPLDLSEIRRYAGMREKTPETEAMLQSCLREVENALTYRVCYCEFPLSFEKNTIDLGFAKVTSSDLNKNLDGCHSILLFAATGRRSVTFTGHPNQWPGKFGARFYRTPKYGADDGNRTRNLLITNQLLCQLSYASSRYGNLA